MGPALPVAVRAYAVACAAIVLLLFPRFAASFGVVRQQPLDLRARADVAAVSFDGGAFMPARGLGVARLISGLPAGMRICYRFTNGATRCGDVRNVREAPARTFGRTVTAILALAFALAGALLAIVGVDRRAIAAAGMLAGFGLLFGADFLEPALAGVRDLSVQLLLIALWEWFPRYAGLVCMLVFAREFPATLPRSRATTVLIRGVTALVIFATALEGVAHVPGLLDWLSLRAQGAVIALIRLNQQLVYAGAALGAIVLALRQRKLAASRPPQLRGRGRFVAAAIAFGFVPPMTLGLIQVIFRQPIPFPVVAASFLTLLAIPAAVVVAVMAKRIDSARLIARRRWLFVLMKRAFPFVRSALLGRLASLPSALAQSGSVRAVAGVLAAEIDAALKPEAVALLVRDEREHELRGVEGDVPALSANSAIVAALDAARAPLEKSAIASRELDEVDRHWLELTRAELLVPLAVSDQPLLGLLAIGEKSSELPFDDREKTMLMTAASAAALAIENHRLRKRTRAISTRPRTAADDPALVCDACSAYYSAAVASRCPVDDAELQPADVPYLLAGKYRIDRRLGAGGMGVVYRARDLELERDVAIKTLPRLSAETASRLKREGRTAANLLHPRLATVFAVESWRGIPMLILEYLDDGTLAERVSRGPLPVETIVRCGCAIAEALGHVHERTILHRDVKPSNIGFSHAAGAKLLDFGLARLLEDGAVRIELPATPRRLTVTSGVVGTPAYLSPEAILGEPPQPDFDLWGLSLTLYEAATGRNPFVRESVTSTLNAILARTVPDPRELRADCPEGLSRFLCESLGADRARRPRSARELESRLRDAV